MTPATAAALRCPVCGGPLLLNARTLRCPKAHSFDLAREGYAYLLRTQENESLIAEIEGGIKREVSVGCAVTRAECSICGSDMGRCAHEKGKRYGGRLCCARLRGSPARRQSVPTFRDSWGRSARR